MTFLYSLVIVEVHTIMNCAECLADKLDRTNSHTWNTQAQGISPSLSSQHTYTFIHTRTPTSGTKQNQACALKFPCLNWCVQYTATTLLNSLYKHAHVHVHMSEQNQRVCVILVSASKKKTNRNKVQRQQLESKSRLMYCASPSVYNNDDNGKSQQQSFEKNVSECCILYIKKAIYLRLWLGKKSSKVSGSK